MSMTNGGSEGPQAQMAMPQIGVLAQYVKDFSFENPHAPRSMAPSSQPPAINVQVNVDAAQMTETDFEVTLKLEGKAIPVRAARREPTVHLMQALRDSAAAGAQNPRSGKPAAKKKTSRRAAAKAKPAAPRRNTSPVSSG